MLIGFYVIMLILFLAAIDVIFFPNDPNDKGITDWSFLAITVEYEEWERTARDKALDVANDHYRKALGLPKKY